MKFVSGTALFLLGIALSQNFMKSMGARAAGRIFDSLTSSPVRGLIGGFLLALILQSSSAATVVIISLAGADMITLSEAYPMLLGAGVGTAVVLQVISFRFFEIAPIFALTGLIIWISLRREMLSKAGALIMCLGLVFMGMQFMESGVPDISGIIGNVPAMKSDVLGKVMFFGAGFLITALFQASAFTIGLFMVLAVQNTMEINLAFAGVLGANAGTGVTGLLAAMGVKGEGRRVGFLNFGVKFVVALFTVAILLFVDFGFIPGTNPAREVANFHLFYNIVAAILLLPLRNTLISLTDKVLEPAPAFKEEFKLKFLSEELVKTPNLAVAQARKEVQRLVLKVVEMNELIMPAFEGDEGAITRLREHDELIDFIEKRVRLILTRISREELSPREAHMKTALILIANHVENIADVMARNLRYLAEKKMRKTLDFSQEGWDELKILFGDVTCLLRDLADALSDDRFVELDKLSSSVLAIKEKVKTFHLAHIERLQAGLKESIVTSSVHIDILGNVERIADYIMDCVYLMEGIGK